MLIATDAGVGRTAVEIFIGKIINDIFVDIMGEIKHIMRDIKDICRALGISNAVNAAARGLAVIVRDVKTHGHPDGVIAGFLD